MSKRLPKGRRTGATRDVAPARTIRWLVAAGIAVLLSAALWLWRTPGTATIADGPIVLFSIDTLRADRLPAYGYTGTRTPHIDQLVADGVLFENAYAHSPQTLPAHTSMLSGRLPFEHGVRDNIGFSVKPDQRLLQHALKELGFATGGFVSAYVLRHQTGFDQGFDVYDDSLPAVSPDVPLGQVQRPGSDTLTAATQWIDRQPSPKFFLFVHIYEPHKPYAPPARYSGKEPYDGEVEYSDEIVGQLLAYLRQKDLYDRATMILLSDHGEGLGDHGEDEHGIFLYRETIHVPLVIKLQGMRGAGSKIAAPVQQIDLVPTVLDLAGAPRPPGLSGRSLRAALEGSGSLDTASIYSESLSPRYHFGWSELYALTDERYRFIRAPRDELYDIAQDPGERTSLAGDLPQVHGAMRRTLETLMANAAVDAPSAVSEEERQKLAALGYVGTHRASDLRLASDDLPDPKDKVATLQRYRRGADLAGASRHDEAIALFRELLDEDPAMTDVWLQLAGLYEKRGRTPDAIAAFKEVVRRNPRDPSGLTGAATGLLRLGKLDEAQAHAELSVEVAPVAAHELLARIAVERGDAATARREAQLTREADPTLPMPSFIEGLLLHRNGDFSAALPHFLQARDALATRTVQMPELSFYIADSLARLERYAEAEPFFAAELKLFPANLRAHAGLAMLYRAMGRDSESDKAVADLVRQSPTRAGYGLAAQLWTMFGQPQKAAAARAEAARRPG
ncbi:MAG TPA: sulfatase-like hydrolase/transferase [Vicinamibacterales bacterium]|nr:sulfatase-like hydrolase/transferase [Vicinamibacterales bacterium]